MTRLVHGLKSKFKSSSETVNYLTCRQVLSDSLLCSRCLSQIVSLARREMLLREISSFTERCINLQVHDFERALSLLLWSSNDRHSSIKYLRKFLHILEVSTSRNCSKLEVLKIKHRVHIRKFSKHLEIRISKICTLNW